MGARGAHGGLLEPPFYTDAFEEAFRFVLEDYRLPARRLAIFIPCAVRKPYSTSPSHRLFHAVLDRVLAPEEHQLLIFGTCGVVPAEARRMYPFAHYRYMLGNVHEERVRRDFLRSRPTAWPPSSQPPAACTQRRAAYCIGLFREAMVRAVERSGVQLDLLLPSEPSIRRIYDPDCPFPEGSLSRAEYAGRVPRPASPRSPADASTPPRAGEETAGGLSCPALRERCPVDRSAISSDRLIRHHLRRRGFRSDSDLFRGCLPECVQASSNPVPEDPRPFHRRAPRR